MIPPTQVTKSVTSLEHFRSHAPGERTRRHRAMRCIVGAVCIVAFGALAAGGAIVVREYALSRSYSSATCHVVNVTYAERDAECTFCEGTVDKGRHAADPCVRVLYPCARVVVNFADGAGRPVGQGVLYHDSMQASSDEPRVRNRQDCALASEECQGVIS